MQDHQTSIQDQEGNTKDIPSCLAIVYIGAVQSDMKKRMFEYWIKNMKNSFSFWRDILEGLRD